MGCFYNKGTVSKKVEDDGARRFEQLNVEETLFSSFSEPKRVKNTLRLAEGTRREAPFTLPWADSDDPGLSGYLHDAFCTV